MYTIKSTSEDGVYYLVNGWGRRVSMWEKPEQYRSYMAFRRPQDAKTSLRKLLKVMPEYCSDIFELITV